MLENFALKISVAGCKSGTFEIVSLIFTELWSLIFQVNII